MKKTTLKIAGAILCVALAFSLMGCPETVYTATYQFTESVVALPAGTDGTAGTTATYVKFGDWPQSEAASGITFKAEPESNGYYVGSDGNYYAKVTVENTKNEYTAGDVKYFKVEPIKWRVLDTAFYYDEENSAKLLLAENILTSNVPFYEDNENNRTIESKTIYPDNYEHSQIRAYLNGLTYQGQSAAVSTWNGKGFLQTAFTAAAQAEIKTTVVDNSDDSTTNYDTSNGHISKETTYACDNTNDKIFLLSEYEVTKYSTEAFRAYGSGNSRIRKTTAYSRANNASQHSTTGYGGYWRLRSPFSDYSDYRSDIPRLVSYAGNTECGDSVNSTDDGVVPALVLDY